MFGIGEARHFKCRVLCWLILILDYLCICMIHYPRKGCVHGQVTSLKFGK